MRIASEHPEFPAGQSAASADGFHFSHTAQFYQDENALIEKVSRFIGSSLGAGDAAIILATQAHRDSIAARLRASGLDLAAAYDTGRYVALDAAELVALLAADGNLVETQFNRVIGDHIHRAARASTSKNRHVAIFGELVALLAADGNYETAIDVEQCWNELAKAHTFSLHCGYSMGVFRNADDIEALRRICDAHTAISPMESYTALTSEEDRVRMIVLLQQKAQALEHEVEARTLAEHELQKRNDELKAAIAHRDEFIAIVAHELRTPVTGLRGYAQLLLRRLERDQDISPDRLTRSLTIVEQQAGKIGRLVGRLLDTAQIESGTLRLDPVATDLVALVTSVIAQQPTTGRHQIDFEGPERLEAMVEPVRFEQVIINLLDNAIKYSPDGGAVTVLLRAIDTSRIELSITDHGTGIARDQREAVFARFHQARPGTHFSGIGLGLYVSRQIVKLHHGTIRIEDPDHPGVRVVVTLPPVA